MILVSQWFNSALYTSLFKFQPGGGPSLHVVYGLIGTKGICIDFSDIFAIVGQYTLNLFVVLTTLEFSLNDTQRPPSGIKFQSEASIGNYRLSALFPALSPLKVEIIDEIKLSDILVIYLFKIQIKGIDHQEAQSHWIFQMSSSIFTYNSDIVIHFIKKIYSIINFKDSKCDLYTMDYISQSSIHCSKRNLKFVLKCTKLP